MTQNRRNHADAGRGAPVADRRRVALVAIALAVLSIGAVVAVSSIDTAIARFSASTTNEGSWFEAGAIEISTVSNERGVPGSPEAEAERAALAIDASGLAPGRVVQRCILTTYRGSIDDARILAYGRNDGGSGLERFLETVVEVGSGADPECGDFRPDREIFTGTLAELHRAHESWATGLAIASAVSSGDAVTMRIAIEVRSDDRAQGLDTQFWLVLEARS